MRALTMPRHRFRGEPLMLKCARRARSLEALCTGALRQLVSSYEWGRPPVSIEAHPVDV